MKYELGGAQGVIIVLSLKEIILTITITITTTHQNKTMQNIWMH